MIEHTRLESSHLAGNLLGDSTRIVYPAMAGIMAAGFLIAVRRMERGVPAEVSESPKVSLAMADA